MSRWTRVVLGVVAVVVIAVAVGVAAGLLANQGLGFDYGGLLILATVGAAFWVVPVLRRKLSARSELRD